MIRFLFRILPWWGYAIVAALLGSVAFEMYESYASDQRQLSRALEDGPPETIKVGQYNGGFLNIPLQERRLTGILRADLGVLRIDGDVSKTFFVLDSANRQGPLVAVVFVGTDNQGLLADVIRNADSNGVLTASGFRRITDWADVRTELRRAGESRDVVLIEGFGDNRPAALEEKAGTDLPFAIGAAVLAAIAAIVAYVRFRNWRKRLAARAGRPQRPAPAKAAPTPARSAPVPQQPVAATVQPDGASPWGGVKEARTSSAPRAATRPVEANAQVDEAAPPDFESVFPGSGSGFRFKSVEEIIRENFGARSGLMPSEAKSAE